MVYLQSYGQTWWHIRLNEIPSQWLFDASPCWAHRCQWSRATHNGTNDDDDNDDDDDDDGGSGGNDDYDNDGEG